MPSITITNIQTMSQYNFITESRSFRFDDALALELFANASADLVALPEARYQAVFQIIDPITNSVVFNTTRIGDFSDGMDFWLLVGNNLFEPYTTPMSYGLLQNWDFSKGTGVYGFRALIRALQVITAPGPNQERFFVGVDAFDVSGVKWFQVKGREWPENP
jgi:hypothetical protein